jgi:hypothetical protein
MEIREHVIFEYCMHPWTAHKLSEHRPPPRVDDGRVGLNGKIGLAITTMVGSMWAAYLFALMALASLPAILVMAFHWHVFPSWLINASLIDLVAWASSYFLQLPVIIVGQNLQAKASDKRAQDTYNDAVAVLHEAQEIQKHLAAQDQVLSQLIAANEASATGQG